ncbi:MAG: ADP-dependent NAD(P)H-hydrate dehydratase [Microbacteriaceae bacterium]
MTLPTPHEFGAVDAREILSTPQVTDDKYSRGVVGFVTGSKEYPGAAVLGVNAAYRTGVGLVRYVGPRSVGKLVLQRRPEVVLGAGRTQAWVIGSGISALTGTGDTGASIRFALDSGVPIVLDAGALNVVTELGAERNVIITPHIAELSRLMIFLTGRETEWSIDMITADPLAAAGRVADELGVVVSLKGHVTHIAAPVTGDVRTVFQVTSPTTWLATAGTGDVLAGMMGTIVATTDPTSQAELARCAATAVYLHGCAANRASAGGPIAGLDVSEEIPSVIREVLTA